MSENIELSTARLILRPVCVEDFENWIPAIASDPASLSGEPPQNMRTAQWLYFRWLAGCWYLDRFSKFSVIERASGRLAAIVGPSQPDGWPIPEIGWNVAPGYRGRGYATEAARAATDWTFKTRPCNEVAYYITNDNVTSQSVAKKLGARNMGPGRFPTPFFGVQLECDVWIQTRDQWQSRRVAA